MSRMAQQDQWLPGPESDADKWFASNYQDWQQIICGLTKTGDLGYIDALPFAPFPHLNTAETMC